MEVILLFKWNECFTFSVKKNILPAGLGCGLLPCGVDLTTKVAICQPLLARESLLHVATATKAPSLLAPAAEAIVSVGWKTSIKLECVSCVAWCIPSASSSVTARLLGIKVIWVISFLVVSRQYPYKQQLLKLSDHIIINSLYLTYDLCFQGLQAIQGGRASPCITGVWKNAYQWALLCATETSSGSIAAGSQLWRFVWPVWQVP